jgi:NAD(P)H-dependent FMN reductase
MRLLSFAASLRRGSWNRKLLTIAEEMARGAGADVDHADFHEFDMPLFDGDLLAASGFPPGAQEMIGRITAVDGVLIASPEYNYSLPGTLKNAIDWISRAKPMPTRGKSGFLLSASTSIVGGVRGLWQLRIPLEGVGMFLYPDMYTLPSADKMFDEQGKLKEAERTERLRGMVEGYLKTARALAGKP